MEENTYGTKFVETEALLAVMNDDQRTAYRLISGMLPGERAEFILQLHLLINLVEGA